MSGSLTGDAFRVGGRDGMSMSMRIDDLRREAGPIENIGRDGAGVESTSFWGFLSSWTIVEGRANDQELTRSKAKT